MFKFPCKINISKLGMFWLGFILCSNVMHTAIVTLLFLATDKLCLLSFLIFLGAWYGSSGNYRNITGNLTLFCTLGTVPTNRRL